MSKQKGKKMLHESDDEGPAGGDSSPFMSMPDLSNLNQESGFLVKTGQLAKSVIISGSRRDADTAFGEPDASSEEDEEMETVEVETKSGKGDARSSRGGKGRKEKVARPEGLTEGEEDMDVSAVDMSGNVGVVQRAPFALTTRYVSQSMFRDEKPDSRLDDPTWALDCIILWIQKHGQDSSKWHLLQDKAARRKAFKWSKVVDFYFEDDRQGEVAKAWFKKHFEGKLDLGGNVYKLSVEIGRMDEVIGRVFTKSVHRPYAYAFLIKLAEAMGQKYLNALNGSIWLEAEDVMNKSWGIWCQRISLREELRGGYSNALVGVKTQDIGDAYQNRFDGLAKFNAHVSKFKQLTGSSDGKQFQRMTQKKRAVTVEAAFPGVELARPPAAQVMPASVELGAVPAPTTTPTGEVVFNVPGWRPYVPNEDDDIKWRKEAGELSYSELDAALATLEAQAVNGAKDRKEIQRMLCEKIDDVTTLEAKYQILRKVQETVTANKRVCKRVGQIFGEQHAADAVNALIKSFLDFYEGKVPDLREAAASVAEEYNPEISQRLKSGCDLSLVPMDTTCPPPSPVASSSSASGSSVQVLTQRSVGIHPSLEFTPGSTSTPTKVLTLLGDSQQSSSQGSGSSKPFVLPGPRIPQLGRKLDGLTGNLVRSNVKGPFKAPRLTKEAIQQANERSGPRPPTPPMSESHRRWLDSEIRRSEACRKRAAKKRRLEEENSWQLKKWREAEAAMKGMPSEEREIYYKKYLAEVDKQRREWTAKQRAVERAEKEKKRRKANEARGIPPPPEALECPSEEDDAGDSYDDFGSEEEELDANGSDDQDFKEDENQQEDEDLDNVGGVGGSDTAAQVPESNTVETRANETDGSQKDLSEEDKTEVQAISDDQQCEKRGTEVQEPEVKDNDEGNGGDVQGDAAEKKDGEVDTDVDMSGDGN